MIHTSHIPDLDIPRVNILSYLFPENEEPYDQPLWFDAVDRNENLSPKQMLQWIKRLMIGLDNLGLQKGDVCMIHTPNHILVPAAYLGIVGGGRAFSAANPIYTVDEVAHQLQNTGAKCLLAHPTLVEKDLEAATKAGLPKDRVFQFDIAEAKPKHGVKDFRSMIGTPEQAAKYRWPEFSEEESRKTVATINYSSGTTGMPKGVMISHHALIANVAQTMVVRWPHLDHANNEKPKNESWLGFLPLYHAYGQLYAVLMCMRAQVPTYVLKQFQYEGFLRAIQDNKITHLQLAPPVLIMMSKRPETKDYDLGSLRGVLSGGAPLSKSLQDDIVRRFNCVVKGGWGMTEVTCGSILHFEARDDGSVGKLIPNNQMRIVDDAGNDVGFDTRGEMCIKAPNVMLGYWKNEAATRDTFTEDGWLKTGDIGLINKEGLIWIVDRKKELIKVNALQVAPAELEGRLLEHDGVADVATVGVQVQGEEWPRAYVVLKDEVKGKLKPKDIQEWFKPRVAKHKALVGGVQFVDEIPKLMSGKIQRKVLREWSKRDAPEVERMLNQAKL